MHSLGSLSFYGNSLYLGFFAGGYGRYELSGAGSLTMRGPSYVGYGGNGDFVQNGGTALLLSGHYSWTYALSIGHDAGASGSYTLNGGSLRIEGGLYIGYNGTGRFDQTGGSHVLTNSGNYFLLGWNSLGSGTYNLSGGTLKSRDMYVGFRGTGTFNQTGGTHTLTGTAMIVGRSARGVYNLSGGTFIANGGVHVGFWVIDPETQFRQTGGTVIIGSKGAFTLGHFTNARGKYVLENGTLSSAVTEYVGYMGQGTFEQTGGTHTLGTGAPLVISNDVNSSGLYKLAGGTLTAPMVVVNSNGTFRQMGGVLNAGGMAISGTGLVQLGAGGDKTLELGTLTFGGAAGNWTGRLDLADNALVLHTMGAAQKAAQRAALADQLASGRMNGYTGTGITSSTVAADAASSMPSLSLVLADNADLHLGSFGGRVVDEFTLIVVEARSGDANLDQKVDAFDLNLLATHWQEAGALWSRGDFNGDEKVDAFDLNLLAAHWQSAVGIEAALAAVPGAWTVPEPANASMFLLGGAGLLARRRRREESA